MSIAVVTLGCTRKRNSIHSWDTLTQLEGDYNLYINWEEQLVRGSYQPEDLGYLDDLYKGKLKNGKLDEENIYIDVWKWHTYEGSSWRSYPRFDQDQARLASIVTARNMCREFALQTGASHLLFIDADIIPPLDIIPKMLAVEEDAVCGLVHGRGTHSGIEYSFNNNKLARGDFEKNGIRLREVEHANIGFTMLSAKLLNNISFRSGKSIYPSGAVHNTSDDPAFHLDAFIKFGKWPVIRMDVIGQHVGDLLENEIAQF